MMTMHAKRVLSACADDHHDHCPGSIVNFIGRDEGGYTLEVTLCECPHHKAPAGSDPNNAEVEPLLGEFYD